MKKRTTAIALSIILGFNTMSLAASANQNLDSDIEFDLDLAEIADGMAQVNLATQTAVSQQTLQQVEGLIQVIKGYKDLNEAEKESALFKGARFAIALSGASLAAVHLKSKEADALFQLSMTSVLAVISEGLSYYSRTHKFDLNLISEVVRKQQEQLLVAASAAGVTADDAKIIALTIADLNHINTDFETSLTRMSQAVDEGKMVVAATAIVGFVVHHFGRFFPQKLKEVIEIRAPKALENASQTRAVSLKTLGGSNALDVVAQSLGMTSKEAEQVIDETLKNLYQSQAELIKELKASEAKQ